MDAILNKKISDDDDFYKLLGCDELSNTNQIQTEFKVRARNLHPDKNPDDADTASDEFSKLQRARDVLTDDKKRQEYDFWRRSGLAIPYDMWMSQKDSMRTSLHWAVKAKKEPMIEDVPERCPPAIETTHQTSNKERLTSQSNSDQTDSYASRFGWSRAPADDMLRRFRNYEI